MNGWIERWEEIKGGNRKEGEPMIKSEQQKKRSINQIDADEDEKFTSRDMKKQSGNLPINGHTK